MNIGNEYSNEKNMSTFMFKIIYEFSYLMKKIEKYYSLIKQRKI